MSTMPDFTSFLALDRSWVERARCNQPGEDPPNFFPTNGQNKTVMTIKEYCRKCPTRTQCLDYAVRMHEETGWWGGLNRNARQRFAKLFQIPPKERLIEHGTTTGYNRGCRQQCCLEAHAAYERGRKERQRAS